MLGPLHVPPTHAPNLPYCLSPVRIRIAACRYRPRCVHGIAPVNNFPHAPPPRPQSEQLLRQAQVMYGCGLRDSAVYSPLAGVLRQRAATAAAAATATAAAAANRAPRAPAAAGAGTGPEGATSPPGVPARVLQASCGAGFSAKKRRLTGVNPPAHPELASVPHTPQWLPGCSARRLRVQAAAALMRALRLHADATALEQVGAGPGS